MGVAKLDRFTDPLFLRQIGRPLLEKFLQRFEPALAGRSVLLPPRGALDQEFFNLMAHLLMYPEGLPSEMSEAIHTINEMATAEGQQRIEQLLEQSGRPVEMPEDSSRGDIAMHLWLSSPDLLARARDLHRLSRLCTFHHFVCPAATLFEPVSKSDLGRVDALESRCDAWFARHNRGRKNTRIELHMLPASQGENETGRLMEYWFLVRHGDTFARTPKIEQGQTDVLHFRPVRMDVIVFNPARNEIRINARTLGERDLYRAAFGEHIFGDPEAFSERKKYTLAPLREDGIDALQTQAVPGLTGAVLRGVEIALTGASCPRILCKATDVFGAVNAGLLPGELPPGSRLTQAWFDLYFEGARLPRSIQLRPPNTLRLSRHAVAETVERWLTSRGFCRLNRETPRHITPSKAFHQ